MHIVEFTKDSNIYVVVFKNKSDAEQYIEIELNEIDAIYVHLIPVEFGQEIHVY